MFFKLNLEQGSILSRQPDRRRIRFPKNKDIQRSCVVVIVAFRGEILTFALWIGLPGR